MVSPFSGAYPSCQTLNFTEQTVEIENPSTSDVYSFTYYHQLGASTPVATVVNDTILAGQTKTLSIPAPVSFTPGVATSFKTWVTIPSDQNKYNDTAFSTISTFASGFATLPVNQGFEGANNCSVATNCGATSCPIPGNWRNAPNGVEDDIDFRVISSGTASAGTGPTSAATGSKYIYLEASGACSDQTARLISPCIDLSTATLPELKFK